MTITIRISESTKQMLEKVKSTEHLDTYDAVITELVKDRLKVPDSMFGRGKGGISGFKREDRLRFYKT